MLGSLKEHVGKIKALLMFVSYLPGEPALRKSQSQVQLGWGGFAEKVVDFARCWCLSPLGTAMRWSFSVCVGICCELFEWASHALLESNWEITVCKKNRLRHSALSTSTDWDIFFEDSCHFHVRVEQSTWTLFYHFLAHTVMLNNIRWYFILP